MATKGVDNTNRRKWDKEEFSARARERLKELEEDEDEDELPARKEPKPPPVQRAPLKQRDFEVHLDSNLGKTQVVTHQTPLSGQAGYYCKVCECVVKDSANYLDHINGKKHQRALGMSMRVERKTAEDVRERFQQLKRKASTQTTAEEEFDARIQRAMEEDEKRKKEKKEKKRDKQEAPPADDLEGVDPEMAALMGFGGFGGSKKT
eukprot:jgi/Mesvir1/12790/Mv22841-RA.1